MDRYNFAFYSNKGDGRIAPHVGVMTFWMDLTVEKPSGEIMG